MLSERALLQREEAREGARRAVEAAGRAGDKRAQVMAPAAAPHLD